MDTLLQDLRFALRQLRRNPGFTVAAVVTLALGIGATTAVYSLVRGLLWRPLPFAEADRIVSIRGANPERGIEDDALSLADLADLQSAATSFTAFGAFHGRQFAVTGDAGADRVMGWAAEPAFFEVAGVAAARGRLFRADEGRPGAAPVIVISDGLWRRRFGGDREIIGRVVPVNGVGHTVVGVLPPRFDILPGDLFTPLVLDRAAPRGDRYALGLARLRPDRTVEQARVELVGAAARLAATHPATNRGWTVEVARYRDDVIDADGRRALTLMLGAVVVVLLVACANVAGLLLARAAARTRELAVRAAVGAGRWRISRQLLIEALALAVIGATLGVLFATWWGDALLTTLPAEDVPPWLDVSLDGRALAVTASVAVLSALVFGLVPALRASRPDLVDELKGGGRGATSGSSRLRQGLVVAQVALSVTLLAAATLFSQSFLAARRGNLGFDDRGLVTARVWFGAARQATAAARVAWMREALVRLGQLPGVTSAALTGPIPGDDGGDRRPLAVEGRADAPGEELLVTVVPSSADFFTTLGTPLAQGRAFTAAEVEDTAAAVVIVGRSLAAQLWPGAGALGRRVRLPPDTAWLTVVGVTGDLQYEEFGEDVLADRLQVHRPYATEPWRSVAILARTSGAGAVMVEPLRRVLRSVDAAVPVHEVRTMTQVRRETTAGERIFVLVFGTFGVLALVMATVGLYGLLAFAVAQREREIGVRMALGARPAAVVWLVVGQAAGLAGIGVVLGLGGGVAAGRVLQGLLWGVSGTLAPLVFVTFVLFTAALVAAFVPARRATRVDPMVALRAD